MTQDDIGKVIEVRHDGRAVVHCHDEDQVVLLMTISDDITPGDWVTVQSGLAVERISEDEALAELARRKQVATAPDVSA